MACFRPSRAWYHVDGGRALFKFPVGENPAEYVEGVAVCRHCIGCKADRARDVSLRTAHEAHFVGRSCFLTITYDREHLPWESRPVSPAGLRQALQYPGNVLPFAGSLRRRDLVLFMKRLRKEVFARYGLRVRAYAVGEYGGRTARPHYHLCLLGFDFAEDRRPAGESKHGHSMFTSAELDRIWGQGMCWINEMGQEVAQYAAKYAVKQQGGRIELRQHLGHVFEVEPPFDSLPRGRALGLPWLEEFWFDVFPRGLVVLRGGAEVPAPGAYMRLLREVDPELFEELAERRAIEGLKRLGDFMPERLASRESVAHARAALSGRDAV